MLKSAWDQYVILLDASRLAPLQNARQIRELTHADIRRDSARKRAEERPPRCQVSISSLLAFHHDPLSSSFPPSFTIVAAGKNTLRARVINSLSVLLFLH